METPKKSNAELNEEAEALSSEMSTLSADERILKAYEVFGESMIATTSFGRDAGLLLHHLYRLKIPIRIFFIDTGFHFSETLSYRDTLSNAWGLRMHTIASENPNRRQYAFSENGEIRISNTDACCGINKVEVQRQFLALPDVDAFVSGLRRDQSVHRAQMPFALVQRGRIKIAPFADWPKQDVDLYLQIHEVPEHPLAQLGYTSIGCSPLTCTQKPKTDADVRSGRWASESKKECGLHLDFGP